MFRDRSYKSTVGPQHSAQPRFIEDEHVIEAFSSDGSDETLQYAFCHGERGAVTTSWICMAAMVPAIPANTVSRSCSR